jgi:hypothetical protein
MPIFVAEIERDSGLPYQGVPLAAIEARDLDEAHEFLLSTLVAVSAKLFEDRTRRWDGGSPIMTREASPRETAQWEKRKDAHRDRGNPAVVWLIDIAAK